MEEMETFQRNLVDFVKASNVSVSKFARMTGISRNTIYCYARGVLKLDKTKYIALRLCVEALAYDDEELQNLMHSVLDKYNVTGHWLSRAMYLY